MLEVDINKIVPVTDARDSFNKIVEDVSGSDALYVLTTNGKPSAVIVGVHHLEKLTGQSDASVVAKLSNLANSTEDNMDYDDQTASATPAADDAATDDAAVAAPAETEVAPAEDMTPAPAADMTPAEPVETEVAPEVAEDPFAAAPEAPAEAPEVAEAPAEDADDAAMPNIGGQV